MSHLHLNVFPISLPDVRIKVGVFPFETRDALRELRGKHAGTHVFKRVRVGDKDLIYAVSLDGRGCAIAPEEQEISLRENRGVVRSLVEEYFIAGFSRSINRKIVDVDPLVVLSGEKEHDFLAQAVGESVPAWLLVRLAHMIEVRVFEFDTQEPFLGLIFDHHSYRRIARPCSEWIAEGWDLTGLYVSESVAYQDKRLQPRLRLAGRVAKVDGNQLHLTDCREGKDIVPASVVEVEADYAGFMWSLNAVFGNQARVVERKLFDLQSGARVGPKKLSELVRIENILTIRPLRLLPGVEATVLAHLDEKAKRFPPVRHAPKALYIFDPTFNSPAETDHKKGIATHGPYSQRGFTPSKPRICVVCQRGRKGEVEQFLQKLFEGCIEPGRKCFFPHGLVKTYRLQGKDVKFFPAEGPTAAAYRKAAQEALASVSTDAERWHLALVQVDQSSHDLHGEANPYLVAKSAFLSQQVPVQEFMTDTMRKSGPGLDFILSNIALACYAKLGGTPWHLKVDNPMAHELVVGLGSASVAESRLGARQRFVGITTLFTSEGRYLLTNLSNVVPFEEYGGAVVEMLRTAIDRVRADMNWQKGDEVRLIFHSFKPMKDAEVDAVKALADSLSDFHVDFAFLHVAHEHQTVLFDSNSPGAKTWSSKAMKGEFAPARGVYLALNKTNSVLALTGPDQVKKPTDGMPYPVLLHLHPASTFTDMEYLTKQVFTFSCHSWRTFDMAGMPVTILYSQLIARLLGRLGALPHFSVDSIHGRLNRLRWFL